MFPKKMTPNVTRISSAEALLQLRLTSQNARHTMARLGVMEIRKRGLDEKQVNALAEKSPRGFYSAVVQLGYESIMPVLSRIGSSASGRAVADEFKKIHRIDDEQFLGFDAVSTHNILGLRVSVYPKLSSISKLANLYPDLGNKVITVKRLINENFRTPSGEPSPISMPEDHPGWATEKPDVRNIRGGMRLAVNSAKREAHLIATRVDEEYGPGTMNEIKNIVVCGIGANDMYLKDLPILINSDRKSHRKLYSIFEPSQLDSLPKSVKPENTLFIGISRGGGTQETLKTLEFAKQKGKMKYLLGYANKGPVKEFTDAFDGISLKLDPNIGGRYMWAKGKIVLIPLTLTASKDAFEEYSNAMVAFDNNFWPQWNDQTVIDLAAHLFMYRSIYNIPGIFACSNNPILEAGLRQFFQLHNEAVGKINNGAIAFGAGMEMLPFAHAGADGVLGAAISAQLYGGFIFDTKYDHDETKALKLGDLLDREKGHAGLTPELLKMACVFPNWAKFSYAGAPNFMVEMDGVNYRNLATLTALYQNLMYPYLIMNDTNPDSNPNVAMVRDTTGHLISALVRDVVNGTEKPIDVIKRIIPQIMK